MCILFYVLTYIDDMAIDVWKLEKVAWATCLYMTSHHGGHSYRHIYHIDFNATLSQIENVESI